MRFKKSNYLLYTFKKKEVRKKGKLQQQLLLNKVLYQNPCCINMIKNLPFISPGYSIDLWHYAYITHDHHPRNPIHGVCHSIHHQVLPRTSPQYFPTQEGLYNIFLFIYYDIHIMHTYLGHKKLISWFSGQYMYFQKQMQADQWWYFCLFISLTKDAGLFLLF